MIARRFLVPCVVLGSLLAGMFSAPPAHAAIADEYSAIKRHGLIFANICTGADYKSECACRDKGDCSVQDIMQVVVNISYFIFAISGTAAFVAFIYGGVMWVTAAGNSEGVDKGRKAISGAFIGLAIIFGAYVFINLLIGILKSGAPPTGDLETTIGSGADKVIETQ